MTTPSYAFSPIGLVRSPFTERAAAPRQPSLALDVAATIELFPGRGYEHALEGLAEWEYVWVVFVFHKNVEDGRGWKGKVLPPRSGVKRGVFGTRSPHRPNPIGLSAVKIERVEGCVVHVRNVDLLDCTPVLDLKPYVAYADAYPGARSGWLESHDPLPAWDVAFSARALAQIDWLRDRGVDLRAAIEAALALGPQPHPYRRIRPQGSGMRLALKEWRVDFEVAGRCIEVGALSTGYRATQLASDPALEVHRDFAVQWAS
ncbi:MAG TPA: tRNA (N6-threonylcarbamoyladenosine(37)-N6)-methyltransferase TrmO [Polyangiaceae bacterium]|nr:tRNA (N6-threonylcarbamoyladenosine(37)-N6)-methyltransferase TrmO [Polyangiaceae bacterium]